MEPTGRPVPVVRALFRYDTDGGRRIAAALCREIADRNSYLLYGIDVRTQIDSSAARSRCNRHRVHQEVVGFRAVPAGIQVNVIIRIENVATAARQSSHTRSEEDQTVKIPGGQWDIMKFVFGYQLRDASFTCFNQRQFTG